MPNDEENSAFDELEHALRHELARELTVASGIPFHEDKDDGKVKPVDQKEARLLQFGSNTLGRGPKPFFDLAVSRFTKRTGVKTT